MRTSLALAACAIASSVAVACANGPSSTIPPSHMSAAQEANAAAGHEHRAAVLERQANSQGETVVCGGLNDGIASPICYSNRRPYTADDIAAEQQMADAAEHRRVSAVLLDAERRICTGVPEVDRRESPFAHREDIATVQILPDGARVGFRSIRGLTIEWLQHVVDCQLALDDARGHDVPERPYCPLVPRGAAARVAPWGDGYFIEIRSTDPRGAAEIVRRASALTP
ncbi:MAG: hypothetical protein ACRELB_26590 [Polyangiaceae bacterium]